VKRTLSAIAPDGTVVTRRTHRDYAYAVLVGPSAGRPGWGAWSFNARRDLAEREYRKAREAWAEEAEVVLVPVEEEEDS
jgi:hypothetical protein